MIVRALIGYLRTIPAVVDKLSAPGFEVLHTGRIPKNRPLPYGRAQLASGSPDYHLRGEIADVAHLVNVSVWGRTEKEASDAADLIRLAPLSGFTGYWPIDGSEANGRVYVHAVSIENETGPVEQPKDGTDAWIFLYSTDYRIAYDRPVATIF